MKQTSSGPKQTSIYLLVIHSTSHYTKISFFLKTTTQIISTLSEHKPRKTVTHVWAQSQEQKQEQQTLR